MESELKVRIREWFVQEGFGVRTANVVKGCDDTLGVHCIISPMASRPPRERRILCAKCGKIIEEERCSYNAKAGEFECETCSSPRSPIVEGWRCPTCKRNNAPWASSCGCSPIQPIPAVTKEYLDHEEGFQSVLWAAKRFRDQMDTHQQDPYDKPLWDGINDAIAMLEHNLGSYHTAIDSDEAEDLHNAELGVKED